MTEAALAMVRELCSAGGGLEPESSSFAAHVEADQGIEIGRCARCSPSSRPASKSSPDGPEERPLLPWPWAARVELASARAPMAGATNVAPGCDVPRSGPRRKTTERKGAAIAEKEEKLEMEGEVVEALRNRMFRIQLDNGHETLGYIAGKMRRHRIRIFLGDRVKVELSPYDLSRGRIVYRYR